MCFLDGSLLILEVFFIRQELAFELIWKECVREEFRKGR